MAKQVKSFRIDSELIDAFSEYSKFQRETFGASVSFSAFANEAIADHLMQSCQWLHSGIKGQSFVEQKANGQLKRYIFSDDQLRRAEELLENATAVWALTQDIG